MLKIRRASMNRRRSGSLALRWPFHRRATAHAGRIGDADRGSRQRL